MQLVNKLKNKRDEQLTAVNKKPSSSTRACTSIAVLLLVSPDIRVPVQAILLGMQQC